MPAKRYVIVGSGPSAVHAALTLLERGKQVEMLDVGDEERSIPLPDATFLALKRQLPDPYTYLLGAHGEGIISPGTASIFEYPSVRNFRVPSDSRMLQFDTRDFAPVVSHARGGLGVAWGANCVRYTQDDLRAFPLQIAELDDGYRTVAARMSIAAPHEDDLSAHLPTGDATGDALPLNPHDAILWHRYAKRRRQVQRATRILMGRARSAINTVPHSPTQCIACDRCLWGCGVGAIYNPQVTLAACQRYPQFRYRTGVYVMRLRVEAEHVQSVCYYDQASQTMQEHPADVVVLAAGAVGSGIIFLRTLQHATAGHAPQPLKTQSLLDTQVVKIPYLLWSMVGRSLPERDVQFNKLLMGCLNEQDPDYPQYIHGEILSLTSLLYHPLIEKIPLGTQLSHRLFAHVKPALGVVTFFLPDRALAGNGIVLNPHPDTVTRDQARLVYRDAPGKRAMLDDVVTQTCRALRRVGCLPLRPHVMVPPPGGGIHYGGTIPMSRIADPLCTDAEGRSYRYRNLYVADGATFPSLPSKSITFSLMANAVRIAKCIH